MQEKIKPQRKAKRKLSDISFEGTGSHIALTSEDNGPANQEENALILKANRSEEFIKKASQVTVTLEITEFLQRFFHLYGTDAELLARSLGFVTAGQEKAALEAKEEELEATEPPEYPEWDSEPGDKDYEAWINSKLASFSIMKSLSEAQNKIEALASLSESDYLALLQDQEVLEKALASVESEEVAKATVQGNSTTVDVEKSVELSGSNQNKEITLTQETKVEVIAKSQFDAIQKAFDDQKEQLQKALASVAQFEAEKKEMITKARKEKVLAAVKDANRAEVLFKAVGLVEDEAEFESVVKALVEMQELVEQSELFVEKGAQVEEQNDKNSVAELLKARLSK